MSGAEEFASVYEEALPAVWRFVASRIPGQPEAEDVTSEIFTRAWQSWPRYEASRGTPTAWVCGIAHHAIADWWRRHKRGGVAWEELLPEHISNLPEVVDSSWVAPSPPPENAALLAESLAALRRSLVGLGEREREALALRFAAGLRMGEIGQILGLSTGATKMMIGRTIWKLRALLDRQALATPPGLEEPAADVLNSAIDSVLAQRRATIPDPLLARLLGYLAMTYQSAMPPELPGRIAACVSCARTVAEEGHGIRGRLREVLAAFGITFVPGLTKAATAPACVVCAAGNALVAPLTAAGMVGPAIVLHEALWVLAPLNLALVWGSFRKHGNPTGLLLAGVGVILILPHLYSHTPVFGEIIFKGSVVLGSMLLVGGVVADWWSRRRPPARVALQV